MQGATDKNKRYKPRSEPVKLNYRLIASVMIIIIAAFLKLMPENDYQKLVRRISQNSADYPGMFSEITETVKKYTVGNSSFTMPLNGEITSPFGERTDPITKEVSPHFGIDIDAKEGTQVLAAFSGKVARCEENQYYGSFIVIEHPEKEISTLYGHLSGISVKPGDEVSSGEVIGLSGSSGRTTGPHLHFEVRKDNTPIDPIPYMTK